MKTPEHFPTNERLHTDVLEEKYGPIHAEVIQHDETVRKVHLMDAQHISRTFAVTFFTKDGWNDEIRAIDAEIQAGGAIGMTFRKHGYNIRKNVIDVGTLEIPDWLQGKFNANSKFAKARTSEFYARKNGDQPVIYGKVVEVYSPDFRAAALNESDVSQVHSSTEVLESKGIIKNQIWEGLAAETDMLKEDAGKEATLDEIMALRRRVDDLLKSE